MPKKSQATTVWTIGHSTRPIQEFLDLLAEHQIQTIADVRSLPGSRKYPQYDQETLAATLAAHGVGYQWLKSLGGRRRAHPGSPNTTWRNASFRGYADYMSSPEFAQGLDELRELACRSRTALMCAEAVWWRCHRSMIADALCADGIHVLHIMDAKHCVTHPMTSPARIVNGQLTYTLP
ncbi:DUF488 domain-containing protein [Paralcaligenes sp. KSB-10]|uniref:DUF488 domain-containing protein n=1 Tax=Paralcaligenes sp. KSB-10 TaxID=2901142 RepID=UPI001E5D9A70|nr:DUF488 domain-containing protein [Paralcaligenes sp. KSB-10]UHL63109.1 DUF488 domain-containing protein [Paralcaligenes sp. KSB-10]